MARGARVALIDGTGLAYRAFYAMPGNLQTTTGVPTGAVYGFAQMFRKLIAGRTPTLGAVVFDAPGGKSARTAVDPTYKANRPFMPPELRDQLGLIDKLVHAHHYPILRIPGVEADDVIGTLAREAVALGHEVVIVSGDKDFAQLVTDQVRLFDATKEVVYDAELVRKRWGVPPAQFVDFVAMVGDESDNIPGAPGIGAKTAAQLLATWGSLDQIYAHLDTLKPKVRTALQVHAIQVERSRRLATIDTAVALPHPLAELVIPPTDPTELNAVYRELEFFSLLSAEDVQDVGAPRGAEWFVCDSVELANAALDAECRTSRPVAVHLLQELRSAKGAPPAGPPGEAHLVGEITGVALSPRPGRALYFPIRATGLGDDGWAVLRPWLEDPARPKILHECKLAYVALASLGIGLRGVVGDTALASYLVDPTRHPPHRLEQVARAYLQKAVQPLKGVVGSGKSYLRFDQLPVGRAGAYACHLVDTTSAAWEALHPRLLTDGLWSLYADLDLPLSQTLADMEKRGVKVDPLRLAALERDLEAEKQSIERTTWELAGRGFNLGSIKQLGTVLYEDLGLPVLKKTKTGYATDSETLEKLAPKHAIIQHILRWRTVAKLIDTYTTVLQAAIDPRDGRVHATFQQTVGASGRLITTEPDLQRTPVRTGEFRQVRAAFVAAPGCLLVSADWSQIELRVLAHISGDLRLISAFANHRDVHRETAAELFSVRPDEVTPEQRNIGKTVNFATIYGQGATSLAQQLAITRTRAKEYIDRFFAHYDGVAAWRERVVTDGYVNGYVTTLWGRRRYIPELLSHNFTDRAYGERIATNAPIQGTSADLCKKAMLEIDRAIRARGLGARLVLQIHDELVLEVPETEVDAVAALVKEHMEGVAELRIPLSTEVGVGPTWADAH